MKTEKIIRISNAPLNVLSSRVLQRIHVGLDAAEAEERITSVTITGRGENYFSVGADIKEIAEFVLSEKNTRREREKMAFKFAVRGQELVLRIKNFPKPVTALINGVCLGGGLELALACHRRIAIPNAYFGFPETSLGIFPGWGGTYFLPKLVGIERATKLIRFGEAISAKEALEIGLIDEISSAQARVEVIPSVRPAALGVASLMRSFLNFQYEHYGDSPEEQEHALEEAAEYFSSVCVMDEAKEGVASFL